MSYANKSTLKIKDSVQLHNMNVCISHTQNLRIFILPVVRHVQLSTCRWSYNSLILQKCYCFLHNTRYTKYLHHICKLHLVYFVSVTTNCCHHKQIRTSTITNHTSTGVYNCFWGEWGKFLSV